MLQFKEYLSRAEYIKSVIDGQVPAVQAQNGTGQKARGAAGGGNDKDAVGGFQISWIARRLAVATGTATIVDRALPRGRTSSCCDSAICLMATGC